MTTTQRALALAGRAFDWLQAHWESAMARRATAAALVGGFATLLLLVELARRGALPAALAGVVPRNHFVAVSLVFGFLFVVEAAGLVFALAQSVAASVGKQFELLALILIREVFVELGAAGEPLVWEGMRSGVTHMAANMAGSLAVFALLVPFHRSQRHRAITLDGLEQASFVRAKKTVALALLGAFLFLAGEALSGIAHGRPPFPFLSSFYTILVLGDVMIVLVSLRYSTTFRIVFRNAAFAAATLMVRVALSAPPVVNAALAVGATLFILATTLAYNAWCDEARRHHGASWEAGGEPPSTT